jgi:hypothetical protein
MAGRLDLQFNQGETFAWTFRWLAGGSDPVDLTGATARMMVRADPDDVTPLLTLTTENGRIALGGVLGTIALTISATVTAALTDWGKGFWDIEIVQGSTVTRLLEGFAVLSKEVTR